VKHTEDLTGKEFGRWKVIGKELKYLGTKWPKWMWRCVCECGKSQLISTGNLVLGLTHGCHKCGLKYLNKHSARTQVLNRYKCNAKNRGREWLLTDEEFFTLTQGLCHYCFYPPSKTMIKPYETFTYNGIDRKDNTLGYTLDNSLPCCFECNVAKGTRSYEDFINWLNRFRCNSERTP
jgi:hypothetical protein